MPKMTTKQAMNILTPYREQIDALDDQILDLLARRTDIVREVGGIKARDKIALVQTARMEQVIERCAAIGAAKGINPDMTRQIYTLIIDEAHRIEGGIIEAQAS